MNCIPYKLYVNLLKNLGLLMKESYGNKTLPSLHLDTIIAAQKVTVINQ